MNCSPPAHHVVYLRRQVLHPGEHRELEAKLKEPQSRVRLEAALTQLKGAMDAKDVHYEDLSGRPKNLCVPTRTPADVSVCLLMPCWRACIPARDA